jgi:hypothetical protein
VNLINNDPVPQTMFDPLTKVIPMSMIKLPISKTVDKKRIEVGAVEVYVPSLEEVSQVIAAAQATEDKTDEGLPVYTTNEANWVLNALRAAAAANARNKLMPGTVDCRPGLTIASTFAALAEPAVGGGNGEALKAISAIKALFKQYVATLGKAAKTTALITDCFANPKGLTMQPVEVREKLAVYFEGFGNWLTETGNAEQPDAAIAYYDKMLNICFEADEDEGVFDDL